MHFARNILPIFLGLSTASILAQETLNDDIVPPVDPVDPIDESSLQTPELGDDVLEISLPDEVPIQEPQAGALPEGPSQNATVNLISALVKKGILTQAEAVALVQQSEQEAAVAQAQAQAAVAPPIDPSGHRVTYIPEVVKKEMRDQIQQELMAQAAEENWGADDTPDWISRVEPFGDIRVRSENLFFPDGNANTGQFPNFDAINSGSPFNTAGNLFSPQYNVDEDRYRPRLRARGGAAIMLGDGFNAGFRVATGSSNAPTSLNQTLGGNGGNFSKYQIWLDRAFFTYDAGPGDGEELLFMFGRFDNPFFSSEVQWDNDVGFDGLAARGRVKVNDCLHMFGTAGVFPVFNTALNYATNQPSKFESNDKWLYGSQIGIEWKIDDDWSAKVGLAYYDFQDIEGKLSSPFVPLTASDAGDTDASRPGFAQRGNTYFPIRNITPTAANNFGSINQFQYYGLATPFRNISLTARVDYDAWNPIRVSMLAEVIKNVAFDRRGLNRNAVNNLSDDPDGISGPLSGSYEGGDMAWYCDFQIGKPKLEAFGDWMVSLGYRYVESDSVVDGFADSNFGGGGTNVKGFHVGGQMALTPNVRAGVRWLSSDEIAGPPLQADTLQVDLNAKF